MQKKNNLGLKFQRLLFLGGAHFQLPAIKKAKELGCIVITVSNNPDEIGHKFSDWYENVSTIDREGVLSLARKYRVDGIMTYAANAAVETVAYVAEQMGLPGNPLNSALILQNKDLFRTFQKEQGLPHPKFCVVRSEKEAISFFQKNSKACVVKPVDAGGSRGQSTISSLEEVSKAFKYAKKYSTSGQVIFEQKLEGLTMELDGDVFFQEGQLAYRMYGHNFFKTNSSFNVPVGEIFPACLNEQDKVELDRQFSLIIEKLGLTSGCINFDGFVLEDGIHIIDIALRNGGNFVPEMINLSSGFDMTEASIYAAFGVPYPISFRKESTPIVSYIINSSKAGVFEGWSVNEELQNRMVFQYTMAESGDALYEFNSGDKALGVIAFKCDSVDDALVFSTQIQNEVKVHASSPDQAKGTFGFRISPFLQSSIDHAKRIGDIKTQNVLTHQFYALTEKTSAESNSIGLALKHYEAAATFTFEGHKILGLERLYRRVLVVEPILQCLANCRHCLRQHYAPFSLSREELSRIARFVGTSVEMEEIRELLITGGDPLLIPEKLSFFLDAIAKNAPQIRIVRIASRLPLQQPNRINTMVIALFKKRYPFRVEMATQINHSVELFPEVREAYQRIRKHVDLIYNQTVLLAGINDQIEDLIELCDNLRYLGIENHYIFHCVPLKGAADMRVPIDRSLDLIRQLTTAGYLSGRGKPLFALMTDVGKITLYEGTILKRKNGRLLLKTHYRLEDRKKWNPSWEIPETAEVDSSGFLNVWYLDGE